MYGRTESVPLPPVLLEIYASEKRRHLVALAKYNRYTQALHPLPTRSEMGQRSGSYRSLEDDRLIYLRPGHHFRNHPSPRYARENADLGQNNRVSVVYAGTRKDLRLYNPAIDVSFTKILQCKTDEHSNNINRANARTQSVNIIGKHTDIVVSILVLIRN